MPKKAPDGLRWCKTCGIYRPRSEFGRYLSAYCQPHWLVWNRDKGARFRAAHPGYDAARAASWRAGNPEKVKDNNKSNSARQKTAGYPNLKRWIAENTEKARKLWREGGRRWREANPDKAAAQRHRKRARKARAPGYHTGAELEGRRVLFDGQCAYCGIKADTWDHVIPLVAGGTNFAWNIVPACRSCNSRKQHTDPQAFLDASPACPTARTLVGQALEKGSSLLDPSRYVRNPYEKVPVQVLWDLARGVFERDGRVCESSLQATGHDVSTFRRRLGSMRTINAVLGGAK